MNLTEAIELRDINRYLIGQIYRSSEVEDLIIVPTDPELFEHFFRLYTYHDFDKDVALTPFVSMDLEVIAVFDRALIDEGYLFIEKLDRLKQDLGTM